TGETVGVLKIKRRSVSAGHAKVRIAPTEDALQVIARHTSAQGLKAVWKSVLHRLQPPQRQVTAEAAAEEIFSKASTPPPRYAESKFGFIEAEPCIRVNQNGYSGDRVLAGWLVQL